MWDCIQRVKVPAAEFLCNFNLGVFIAEMQSFRVKCESDLGYRRVCAFPLSQSLAKFRYRTTVPSRFSVVPFFGAAEWYGRQRIHSFFILFSVSSSPCTGIQAQHFLLTRVLVNRLTLSTFAYEAVVLPKWRYSLFWMVEETDG